VANAYLAIENDLTIVPVLDNSGHDHLLNPDEVAGEMKSVLGIEPREILKASGKTGAGVDELIQAVIDRIPPPPGDPNSPLRLLIYNSHFDTYKGVVVYVRLMEGSIRKGQRIRLMRGGTEHEVLEVGRLRPLRPCATNWVPARSVTLRPRSKISPTRTLVTPSPTLTIPRPNRWPGKGTQADGVLGTISDKQQTTSRPCVSAGQAQAQRQLVRLSAGGQ
jgi:hypothetical protein